MDLSKLWDAQVLIYVGLTCGTVVMALIVLAITSRRVNFLMSEVQSLRAEMKMLDEGVQTVTRHLEAQVGRERNAADGAPPAKR